MPNVDDKKLITSLQLKAIEMLGFSLKPPATPNISLERFNFNIELESRVDTINTTIFIIVHIDINSEDQKQLLGSLTLSCIYNILNFDEIITPNAEGEITSLPAPLMEMLSSISISTARGVMFSTFKGTFLQNALLPIIDTAKVNSESVP